MRSPYDYLTEDNFFNPTQSADISRSTANAIYNLTISCNEMPKALKKKQLC